MSPPQTARDYDDMKYHAKRIIVFTLAIIFIALGIIGLALPFLQGFLFLAIGVFLLSLYSPKVRAWLDTHTVKYPNIHSIILKVEGWFKRILGET